MAMSVHPVHAVVVPDPSYWASCGIDLRAIGIRDVPVPAAADALVVPDAVPAVLAADLRELAIAFGDQLRKLPGSDLVGSPLSEALAPEGRADDEHHDDHRGDEHAHETDHDVRTGRRWGRRRRGRR